MAKVIVVGGIFELAGEFSPEAVKAYDALNERVEGNAAEELVRYELELVEDLCTNVPESLTESHLLRVAVFLNSKLDSL